jgi:cyanophycin synthetase
MTRPDPYAEIRLVSLRSLRGANFWSTSPITRLDVAVGEYDEISSAEVPGFTDALVKALPGLREHRCSIGERGGFITRLRRGTYAPHIAEHVGLELQTMVGHDVGFGRARGGDREGEYTVVFEHLHAESARAPPPWRWRWCSAPSRASWRRSTTPSPSWSRSPPTPDIPALHQSVLCGITGGDGRAEVRDEMARRGIGGDELVVDVAPAYILNAGLPYDRSELAIVLDSDPVDVPERYREKDRARQLVSVLADGVRRGGVVVCPAREWEVQDRARDAGCLVAVFATDDRVRARDTRVAHSVAFVRDGHILVDMGGETMDDGELLPDVPVAAQVAAALAVRSLRQLKGES